MRFTTTNWAGTTLTAALVLTGTALIPAAAVGAAGPGLTRYTVHIDQVAVENLDAQSGPCGAEATITFDARINASIAATVPGLTQDQVIALASDDPDGLVRQLSLTTTGGFVIQTGGHTYTGRFTQKFVGDFLPNGMYVNHGMTSVTAISEIGTLLRLNSQGFNVDNRQGITVHSGSHMSGTGCL